MYWTIYKNLEKEIIGLTNSIHFCDEQKNVFSSNNPGNERPVQYDYQIKNVQQQWENLIKELRRAVNTY